MALVKIAIIGGLLAGTLDILYMLILAYADKKIPPKRLFQYIASGLYGVRSYKGGVKSAALGCLFHYVLAIGMALVFGILAQQFPGTLLKYPLASGFGYGLILFLIMHYVIVPKSNTVPKPSLEGITLGHELVSHMLFVGTPIAFTAAFVLL